MARSVVQAIGAIALLTGLATQAFAHPVNKDHDDYPVLQLNAEAAKTVNSDELTVTLAHELAGTEVSALNTAVLKRLNDALALAKAQSGIDARLSSVHTTPEWDGTGKRKGWRVRGEIVLKSKNTASLSDLTGRLGETLQFANAQYGISPELQAKTRDSLIGEATQAFQSKAAAVVKALGYSDYEIASVTLSDGGAPPMIAVPMARMTMAMAKAASPGLPEDGGSERLTVTVSGSVQLKK